MTNERLKEIYQLVLENLEKKEGICLNISCIYYQHKISWEERDIVKKHFKSKRPGITSKFWWNFNYNAFNSYWWTMGEKGFEQRKRFLQHIIDKL